MRYKHSSMPNKKPKEGTLSVWMSDDIFDRDALAAILDTPVTAEGSRRGTASYTLLEVFQSAKKKERGNASRFIDDVMPRERNTRWDVRFTSHWVDKMKAINVAFQDACDLAESVRKMNPKCKRAKIEWHAMIVHPGSPDQPSHVDDSSGENLCYYTLIVPLTSNPDSGGTHFPVMNHVFRSFGGALVFDGGVTHAGLGNRSKEDRIFLYAAIFSNIDNN